MTVLVGTSRRHCELMSSPTARYHANGPGEVDIMTLEMKTQCEKCGDALSQEGNAYICSYECTFCPKCAVAMKNVCPNCGGELVPRPSRTT